MTALDIILSLVFGSLIGFVIGLTSVGAGALVLPTLTLVFGMPASVAIGTATLYAFLTKIFATWRHWRLKTVNIHVALTFLTGAAPANALAAWLISRKAAALRDQVQELHVFQTRLTVLIAVVIVICAFSLVRSGFKARRVTAEPGGYFVARPALRKAMTIIAGAVVGGIMGASGIGGGVLVVPVLIMLLGLPPRQTVGTSIFIALFLSCLTALIYAKSGETDFGIAIVMTIGAWGGVYYGGRLVTRLPERPLVITVAITVMVAAVIMCLNVLRSGSWISITPNPAPPIFLLDTPPP